MVARIRYNSHVTVLLSFVLVLSTISSEPPDLVVSSYYWGRIEIKEVDTGPFPRNPLAPRRPRRGFDPNATRITQRETYALVKNSGTRKIKAVTWDYVFYEDAKHEHEIKRFEFRTKETIGPGEMKFLGEYVTVEAPSSYGAVVIDRLEFEDGSSWERAKE